MATIPIHWSTLWTWKPERQRHRWRRRRSTRPTTSTPTRSLRTNWTPWWSIWSFPLGKPDSFLISVRSNKSFSQVCFDELHRQGGDAEHRRHWFNGKPLWDPSLPNWPHERAGRQSFTNLISNFSVHQLFCLLGLFLVMGKQRSGGATLLQPVWLPKGQPQLLWKVYNHQISYLLELNALQYFSLKWQCHSS